jgi:glutamate synthase (NADPH/NADH) large chain
MMRVCHLDTCPVGVATQSPQLRSRYPGKAEHVVQFFHFVAQEVREHLAALGFRSLDEAIGRVDVLRTEEAVEHWKTTSLDLSPVFAEPETPYSQARRRVREQDHGLHEALDRTLIKLAEDALEDARPVRIETPVRNTNRTVGTLLGAEVTRRYGGAGLADGTIHVALTGSAGQSLGAFLPPGVTLDLVGDANDYVGKGLCGGRVVVRPHPHAPFTAEEQVLAGNVVAYGATSGEVFLRGGVGERFCVRNSGALAVAEGVGDHAFEYMTGGCAVVLGGTGRNLAAGMSGGVGYVLDLDPVRANTAMVDLLPPDEEDFRQLRSALQRHREATGSTVAGALLDDWERRRSAFTKVMPQDYQRVLDAARRARAEGRDENEVIMEASRG